jgi:hypothetical protein
MTWSLRQRYVRVLAAGTVPGGGVPLRLMTCHLLKKSSVLKRGVDAQAELPLSMLHLRL